MDGIVSQVTDKPETTGAVSSFSPISQSVIRFTGNPSYFMLKGKEINVVETRNLARAQVLECINLIYYYTAESANEKMKRNPCPNWLTD